MKLLIGAFALAIAAPAAAQEPTPDAHAGHAPHGSHGAQPAGEKHDGHKMDCGDCCEKMRQQEQSMDCCDKRREGAEEAPTDHSQHGN